MSRGIFQALDFLKDMIENILPKTDSHQGFISINNGNGITTLLNDRFEGQRQFTLEVLSLPLDDGSSGLSGRKRVSIEAHIKYAIPTEEGFKIRIMTEDASKIIDTIKGPQYNFNTTGIISVIPGITRAEVITDNVGETIGHLLIVPFDLLYLESN